MEVSAQDVGSDAYCTLIVTSNVLAILSPPRIKNFKEAVQTLEAVQTFLQKCDCLDLAHTTSLLLNDVASIV